MWKCNYCGKTLPNKPEDPGCPSCGIRLATNATPKKHEYLEALCTTNKYNLVIDGCAGSGMLQYPDGELKEGSPLILEKLTHDRCICIEYNQKTFDILSKYAKEAKLVRGDCNDFLLKYVDGKEPTLIFIDPNGWGIPAIRYDIVSKMAKTENTDVLVQFSWRICREIGYTRRYLYCKREHCPSPTGIYKKFEVCEECTNRLRASTWKESLDIWWGDSDWLAWVNFDDSYPYAKEYANRLKDGGIVDITAFSGGEQKTYRHDFYMILATKFNLPKYGVLKWMS